MKLEKHNYRLLSSFAWFCAGIGLGIALDRLFTENDSNEFIKMRDVAKPSATVETELDRQLPEESFQIGVLERALDGRDKVIKQLESKNKELANEYQRLQSSHNQAAGQIQDNERIALYQALEPVLVHLPVLVAEMQAGEAIQAEDVLQLMKTIPRRLEGLGVEAIGVVGQPVEFDPRIHTAVPSVSVEINPGDEAIVVVPGYMYKDRVLIRAEVER